MQPFKRGITLILKRSNCPVIPAAVTGAFEAFPRTRTFPHLWRQRLTVNFGAPISHDELLVGGIDAALKRLESEIASLLHESA